MAVLVLAASILCACSPDDRQPLPSTPPAASITSDASTLVLTHSWSGRTAVVGRAWADMLGARFLRYSDGPEAHASAGIHGLTAEELRPRLELSSVQRMYLGFPIWSLGPAPPAWQLVGGLDLDGIEVVLFFTYLHEFDDKAVERLEDRLRSMGAIVLPHIAMRVPVSMTRTHLERRAWQALLARPDLWRSDERPIASCSAGSAPAGHVLCRVPGGRVWLGDDGSEASPPGSVAPRRLEVGAFEIDRAEVTIAQYQRCEQAGGCPVIERYDPCSVLVADGDDRPMPCVSFDAARAYCRWVGMRLPSEAEWTRAARGDGIAPYPWGFAPPGSDGIVRGNLGEKLGAGMPGYALVEPEREWPADGVARLAPGCSFPDGDSPFGVCDLAGNIGEWVETEAADAAPVFKGGTWMDPDPWTFRIASRGLMSLDREVTSVGYYLTGLRCARSAAP